MELDPVEVPIGIGEAGERGGIGLGGGMEAVRRPHDRVAVAHPHRLLAVDARKEAVLAGDRHRCGTVFAPGGRRHLATEVICHQLQAVADP